MTISTLHSFRGYTGLIKRQGIEISINDILYRERLNLHCHFFISELQEYPWSALHINEAHNVLNNAPTERYKGYSRYIIPGILKSSAKLLQDKTTRQAIIHIGHNEKLPSCLTTIQFLIRDKHLNLIASFRSWELEEFAFYDICLLTQIANELAKQIRVPVGMMTINASSAHVIMQTE